MSLQETIERHMALNVKRDADGNILCKRCNNIVPPEFRFLMQDPDNTEQVWGPCCSKECLCHLKICSHCQRDFVIDASPATISYFGDGVWLCKECESKRQACTCCGSMKPLLDTPIGKVCRKCFDEKHTHRKNK